VAMQQGRYVGKLIASRVAGRPAPPPFRYFDKGNMAVIDRNFAILESGKLRLSGFPAWAAWAAVHLVYLPQHRGETMRRWAWAYFLGERGSRLILDAHAAPPPPVRSGS